MTCAKLILFGEHSVVYGQPAVAVPIRRLRMAVSARPAVRDEIVGAPRKALLAISAAKKLMGLNGSYRISVKSGIPFGCGLGSSAAFCVSLARALFPKMPDDHVALLSNEVERVFHLNPSGVDTAVCTYEEPVYFVRGRPPRKIAVANVPLVVAVLGRKPPTGSIVDGVRQRFLRDPSLSSVFLRMGRIANLSLDALRSADLQGLGNLMTENHKLLSGLGVSSPRIERVITAAKDHCFGAKLTGAGRGGAVVLVPKSRRLVSILRPHCRMVFSFRL